MVGAEVAEANAEETPFLPSKILFNHRIFSSILDIEEQRSVPSTMAQFNFGEKFRIPKLKALETNCHGSPQPNH
jgi:hypothetical protein